ncbi:sigma-54-dependent Fis family transcriptional regulator [Candidatus Poribacteria bacterium]|nr:sigma-54-dependent Fis family transcriptional regulator [Candidatus Poribacteria bacterium]
MSRTRKPPVVGGTKALAKRADGITEQDWYKLLEISQRVNSSLDVEAVLEQTLEMLTQIVQADASSIWLVDEDTRELYCAIATGSKGEQIRHMRIPWDVGIVGWVVQNDNWYLTTDAVHDDHHARDVAVEVGYDAHTLLCVPMHSRGRVVGCIEVINKLIDGSFTDKDMLQLSIFANLVGLAIDNARFFSQVQQEYLNLRQELGDRRIDPQAMVATSRSMTEVVELVERVAPTDSTVLIRGESGTGKEIVAQTIHSLSLRARGPFVAINCGGIPENLLESELFGHEKGAFTGATARRIGRFELAKSGTLFLDEIGDMPLPLQTKLLRVLQSRKFERLGGNQVLDADVRIIAATNQDLEELIRMDRFREDLYYRLNVISIFLPALRERRDDILPLAHHFMSQSAAKLHRHSASLHADTAAVLMNHEWPGNIRELENAIEHALVLARAPEIRPTDLPFNVRKGSNSAGRDHEYPDSLEEAQRIFRRAHIRAMLERFKGNRTRAAEALDIQRTYLSRLIRDLEIDNDDVD